MAINIFGITAFSVKNQGAVWQPKARRLMVGRDLAPIASSRLEQGAAERRVTVGNGDDVAFMSGRLYNSAKSQAQNGLTVRGFRSFSDPSSLPGSVQGGGQETPDSLRLFENDNRLLSLQKRGGSITISVYEKVAGEDGRETLKELESVTFSGDARISWAKNGDPQILTGGAAHSGGLLKAEGRDEILIRNSASNVKAGANSTVYNFSEAGGEFSGGSNVTYLGAYKNSLFSGSAGENNYAGYFERSEIRGGNDSRGTFSGVFENTGITAGDGADVFSGYFSAAVINAGNGDNTFSGLFLDRSELNGGDDKDAFSGRFVTSNLYGGNGDDSFGSSINLNNLSEIHTANGKSYRALAADFINSAVEAGAGDDKFTGVAWQSRFDLGDGQDTAGGVFSLSSVAGGAGNDKIGAMYSQASLFDAGAGDDEIGLGSAASSSVKAGAGSAKISLGHNGGDSLSLSALSGLGGDNLLARTAWLSPSEARGGGRGLAFGELRADFVDLSEGDNELSLNNGKTVNKVAAGGIYEAAGKSGAGGQAGREDSAGAGELIERAADRLSILENSTLAAENKDEAETRRAVGRYAAQYGDAPLQEGGLAAVVKTGLGGNINFHGLDRGPEYERVAYDNAVAGLLRKASDAYAWTAGLI